MPIQPVKSYFDGDRTVPFQYGPVTITRPFANTPTLDTYAIERMTAFDVLPSQFAAGSRIAVRTSYTNWVMYSEQFDNGIWGDNAVTVVPNYAANPEDGLITADRVLETATTATHFINTTPAIAAGQTTLSIIAAASGRSWVYVRLVNGTDGEFAAAYFNLSTGAIGTIVNGSAKMTALGNGYYRCSVTGTSTIINSSVRFYLSSNGSDALAGYAGDATKGIVLWGAQLELASAVGPYISTTATARTISSPDWWDTTAAGYSDGDQPDPFAFLCDESDPSTDSVSGDYLFKRTWARIPKTQTVGTTIAITKPSVPNQSAGTPNFIIQSASSDATFTTGPGSLYAGYLFSPIGTVNGGVVGNNTFYGPMQIGSTPGPVAVSSGVFTLNYRGTATGNLNYNDSIATIQSALNALATVIADGLTFSGGTNALSSTGTINLAITVGSTNFRVVINPAGFSPSGAATMFTYIASPTMQQIGSAYIVALPAHGLDITKTLAVTITGIGQFGGSIFVLQPRAAVTGSGQWSIIDVNTIAYSQGTVGPSFNASLFGNSLRVYTPGPSRVRANLVTNFYLPGVTVGITTATDIPVPAPLINDTDFLAAVLVNQSGFLNYDATDLVSWIGPIFNQTQKQIDFSDV